MRCSRPLHILRPGGSGPQRQGRSDRWQALCSSAAGRRPSCSA
nr:MAG TPA: hypothetical protein [Caudoviricetes sp.]